MPTDSTLLTKRCGRCKKELPVWEFYRRSDRPGQFTSHCKQCFANASRERNDARRPAPTQLPFPPLEKACAKCGLLLPLDSFGACMGHVDGKKSHCKTCRNAEKKDYKTRNAEKVRESDRQYYRENKDEIAERIKKCMANNPEQYKAMHSRWKSENKDAVNASTHKRRARLKSAGSWTQDDWQRLKATYDWRCLGCGQQEVTDGITLCFDHIIPLSTGGWNLISNGQPLCRSCNSLKHRKVLDLRGRSYPFQQEGEQT